MQGYIETLIIKENALDAGTRKQYLEIARRHATHLNRLIQDLFAYAVRCFHYEHIKLGSPEILRAADVSKDKPNLEGILSVTGRNYLKAWKLVLKGLPLAQAASE